MITLSQIKTIALSILAAASLAACAEMPVEPTTSNQFMGEYTRTSAVSTKWQPVSHEAAVARVKGNTIAEINDAVNASIRYVAEPDGQDHWQTPAETFALGTGDCEDFAIAKYYELKARGLAGQAWVMVLKTSNGQAHAALAVADHGQVVVLDNRSDYSKPMPWAEYARLNTALFTIDMHTAAIMPSEAGFKLLATASKE